jgi:hypothetical protein
MLRLTLEIVPRGNERERRTLGTIEIENIGGNVSVADYAARARGIKHADATLQRINRRAAPWNLVMAALRALFGEP